VLQYRRISFVLSKGSRMIWSFQRKFAWFLFMLPGLPLTVLTFDNGNIDEGFEEGTKETASAAVNFPPCSNGCKPCRHFISGRGCHLGDYCTYCHAQVHIVDMKKYQCKRNRKQKKKKSHRQTQEADNSSIQSDFKPIDCSWVCAFISRTAISSLSGQFTLCIALFKLVTPQVLQYQYITGHGTAWQAAPKISRVLA